MKIKKLLTICFILAIAVFMFTGCSKFFQYHNNDFNAGETLTPEELDRLSNQIFTDDGGAAPFDNTFYWTDSGSKVHLFSDCGHLKNSDNILSGDENAVRLIKKSGVCSICLKKAGMTEADFDFFENSTSGTTDDTSFDDTSITIPFDGTFYWTDSGSKVHLFSDCGHLKNSDNILSGDENAVRLLKKSGVCSTCLKKAGMTEADFDFIGDEDISEDLSSTTSTDATTPNYSANSDTLFYWTESGGKYHLFSDCGHLKNSAKVLSGTMAKLTAAEKDGPCSSCLKKAGLTQEELLDMIKSE